MYRPLRIEQTRLLRIHRSDDAESKIVCELINVSHVIDEEESGFFHEGTENIEEEAPEFIQYDALSYTWGDSTPVNEIEVNGAAVAVKRNLFDALVHLRLPANERYVWIDALCVNQDDNEEKAKQVEMMFSIYQNAPRSYEAKDS